MLSTAAAPPPAPITIAPLKKEGIWGFLRQPEPIAQDVVGPESYLILILAHNEIRGMLVLFLHYYMVKAPVVLQQKPSLTLPKIKVKVAHLQSEENYPMEESCLFSHFIE
uniref:Uncharacterized protein n=1 Tax=Nelumbo nucifera TaxID=4432 RepID=A0A822YIM5_NELNU|nr:TPA_asm: hypothetical protein HUJ06_010824 [Nelumbo nucifera]